MGRIRKRLWNGLRKLTLGFVKLLPRKKGKIFAMVFWQITFLAVAIFLSWVMVGNHKYDGPVRLSVGSDYFIEILSSEPVFLKAGFGRPGLKDCSFTLTNEEGEILESEPEEVPLGCDVSCYHSLQIKDARGKWRPSSNLEVDVITVGARAKIFPSGPYRAFILLLAVLVYSLVTITGAIASELQG